MISSASIIIPFQEFLSDVFEKIQKNSAALYLLLIIKMFCPYTRCHHNSKWIHFRISDVSEIVLWFSSEIQINKKTDRVLILVIVFLLLRNMRSHNIWKKKIGWCIFRQTGFSSLPKNWPWLIKILFFAQWE